MGLAATLCRRNFAYLTKWPRFDLDLLLNVIYAESQSRSDYYAATTRLATSILLKVKARNQWTDSVVSTLESIQDVLNLVMTKYTKKENKHKKTLISIWIWNLSNYLNNWSVDVFKYLLLWITVKNVVLVVCYLNN